MTPGSTILMTSFFQDSNFTSYINQENKLTIKSNLKKKPTSFRIGEMVWLEGEAWEKSSLFPKGPRRRKLKLSSIYYTLELPSSCRSNNKWHVSCLRKFNDSLEPAANVVPTGKEQPRPFLGDPSGYGERDRVGELGEGA